MTIKHLAPKAARKQVRNCAREAMKLIEATLKNRKVQITSVVIFGGESMVGFKGGRLVAEPVMTPQRLTIEIETWPMPLTGNR